MERNILHHQYRSDQPVFKVFFFFFLCAGTNAIRKPVISPEPCQSDSLGEGSEENAGSRWANNDQQSHSKRLSNQGGRSGHGGLPHSTNCSISALAGTVLVVNQSVTTSTASTST